MIRYTQTDFDAEVFIEEYLATPATVTIEGRIGRFDTLRVALEHLQSHGTEGSVLAIQAPGDELEFASEALDTVTVSFARWRNKALGPIG